MSAPVTSPATAILVIARMAWLRMVRGRALWLSSVLLGIPVLVAVVASGRPGDVWLLAIGLMLLNGLALFIPALHCSGILADELDDRTYTYLFTRPIPRWTLIVGKLLATYLALLVAFAIATVISHMLIMAHPYTPHDPYLRELPRTLAALAAGLLASCTMAASLGAMFPKRPFASVFGYLLIVELALGALPSVIAHVSIGYHIRVMAMNMTLDRESPHSFLGSVLALAELSVIFLGLAFWRITRAEMRSEV